MNKKLAWAIALAPFIAVFITSMVYAFYTMQLSMGTALTVVAFIITMWIGGSFAWMLNKIVGPTDDFYILM